MRRRLTATLLALTAGAAGVLGATPAHAAPLPVTWNWTTEFLGHLTVTQNPPPGAEDLTTTGGTTRCDVSKSPTKRPLILVHGTWENQNGNWRAVSPYFTNAGFCVYTFNYGGNPGDAFWGYKAIAANAVELSAYVEKVLRATGARQVDLIGHSQGGLMPRYYIKKLGGMPRVNTFVALAPNNNGTTASGIATLTKALGLNQAIAVTQPAAIDQTIDSPFLRVVNACPTGTFNVCRGDTVKYTVLQTNGDQFDTPYTNAFLTVEPGGPAVDNILVNTQCPLELAEHVGMTYSRNVVSRALRAFVPGTKAACVVSLPYVGG